MNTLTMKMSDIFHFQTGEVILAGKLSEEIPIIRSKTKYIASLVIDGRIYQENIRITGEMIGGRPPDGCRSFVTMEKLEIDSDFVKNHDCQLVLVELV